MGEVEGTFQGGFHGAEGEGDVWGEEVVRLGGWVRGEKRKGWRTANGGSTEKTCSKRESRGEGNGGCEIREERIRKGGGGWKERWGKKRRKL